MGDRTGMEVINMKTVTPATAATATEMSFEQIEVEFASHIEVVSAGKVAAKASRQSTKALIALIPAYEAEYQGNVAFSTYVAERYGMTVRTVQMWLEAPAKAEQRKAKHRIRMALVRAKAKLTKHKNGASHSSQPKPIRMELVAQVATLYADMTREEWTRFEHTTIVPDTTLTGGANHV
jgi:hypothetical protein